MKLFKTFVADFSFYKKKAVSSVYAVYRKSKLQTFKLLILGFLFLLKNAISKTRMKWYTDKGSPCFVHLSNLK